MTPRSHAEPVAITDGFAAVGDVTICYQTRGAAGDPALLLVMGFGMQLDAWEESFCDAFVRGGYFVIRYDHRDIGLSSKFDGVVPDLRAVRRGDFSTVPYALYDMADDAAGLLDVLGVRAAHVVGASMGGMVAQELAIRHPDRVASLCSIMSTTGDPTLPGPAPETAAAGAAAMRATTREELIEGTVEAARCYAGGGFAFDAERIRRQVVAALERSDYPEGKLRHVAAVTATGDRTAGLRRLRMPTVVIHGSADPLVPLACGAATAAAVPGAELVVIEGLGHELPVGVHDRIVDIVLANADQAERSAS